MPSAPTRSPRARAIAVRLFLLAWIVYAFTAGGSLTTTDASVTFDVTEQLIEHGTVALSGNLLGNEAERGSDGRYYSPFGIGQSLFNVPFYLAGRAVTQAGFRIGKPDTIPKAAVAMSQTLVGAAIVAGTFWLAVLVTGRIDAAIGAALTLAFGTLVWPYARFGFNQPLACATLLAAVIQAHTAVRTGSVRAAAASGAWLAASLLTRHEMALAAAPIGAWLLLADRKAPARFQRLAVFTAAAACGLAAWMALNAWRFGNPFDPGLLRDPVPGFGSSIVSGLAGLLFSPGASILLYSPVVVLGAIGIAKLARHDSATALWLASFPIAFLLFYATLGNWLAGRSYGSRYLVVVLPYLAVGWAVWLERMPAVARAGALIAVIGVGAVVQLPGVVVDYAKVSEDAARRATPFTTEERQWDWRASSLVLGARAAVRAVPANVRYLTGRETPPPVVGPRDDEDRSFSRQFAFSLDFWWMYLYYLGAIPRGAVAAIAAAFLAAILAIARRLRAEARRAEL
ncbi:MAG: hypothetical protein IT184_03580 [Acidobacteria bacterium]|nr:hypothetical protein [Acidobacteriota bacterium]